MSRAPLAFLPAPLRGALSFLLLALNTVVGASILLPLALVKLVLPLAAVRRRVDCTLNAIVEAWIRNNSRWMALSHSTTWDLGGLAGLNRNQWYLLIANHQSWADIFVLQKTFGTKIPLLKFFLKQQLIWVPFAGLAWWALDFPFMKRHSARYLREHPERRGDDLEAIRRSCEKFSLIPTSVASFPEGTRFTDRKRNLTGSPFLHLLRPRVGGVALALGAMGHLFHSLLDVTIFYPDGAPTFFEFLSGKMKRVIVRARDVPIPSHLLDGGYSDNPEVRELAREWINGLWSQKDALLEELAREVSANPGPPR